PHPAGRCRAKPPAALNDQTPPTHRHLMNAAPGIVKSSTDRRATLATTLLVRLGEITNRTFALPIVIFYPTGRCNSRCVSCDWWKQTGADDLALDEIADVARALPGLGTRMVVFSGGEPLLRPEVFAAAELFRAQRLTLHLLTSGVLL